MFAPCLLSRHGVLFVSTPVKKGKVLHTSEVAHTAGAYPGFLSMKRPGRVSRGGPCSLVPFQNCPMFPCSHTFSECFRTVIFRILFPCSQKLANVPLFPSIFCQCSLVPQNPWETLTQKEYCYSPWMGC